jgi:hypothetical protein
VLKSQLGSGTNTTAAPSGTATITNNDPNAGQIGGGSAEGNRGGGSASSSSSDGTNFVQGVGSNTSDGVRVAATWGGVVGLFGIGLIALM